MPVTAREAGLTLPASYFRYPIRLYQIDGNLQITTWAPLAFNHDLHVGTLLTLLLAVHRGSTMNGIASTKPACHRYDISKERNRTGEGFAFLTSPAFETDRNCPDCTLGNA